MSKGKLDLNKSRGKGKMRVKCPQCHGERKFVYTTILNPWGPDLVEICSKCGGKGRVTI